MVYILYKDLSYRKLEQSPGPFGGEGCVAVGAFCRITGETFYILVVIMIVNYQEIPGELFFRVVAINTETSHEQAEFDTVLIPNQVFLPFVFEVTLDIHL